MSWKYTLDHLKKNLNVAHVHNSTMVECIYEKRIDLHRDYKETNLTKYLQNSCNLKNKQSEITSFFNYPLDCRDLQADLPAYLL